MAEYFTRKISEGTVKRTHLLSSDSTIKLEMLVQKSGKVIDSLIKTKDENAIRQENFRARLGGLRINGLPIVYEDLGDSFDADEITEVIAFINDANMSMFSEYSETEGDSNPNAQVPITSNTEEVKNS